ncbi:MAG: DUF11 domain-containing protein [Deltaproteobacteria bacterium]|nr:DUF11 domain-containing protein [Deltaproteobacteria bacterium]
MSRSIPSTIGSRAQAWAGVVTGIACGVALVAAAPASAIADGTAPARVVTHTVFGAAVGVGNTLMEHDGTANFAVRVGGSEATIPLSRMPADATVVRAFLFWGGTYDPGLGVPQDRNVDLTLPDGTPLNDLSVDTLLPGEPNGSLNRCLQRNHTFGGGAIPALPMYVCRREVTFSLQQLGAGGAVGSYGVDDVDLYATDCGNDPGRCQAFFGGWGVVVLWESPTEPVRRDLVLYDGFYALDEQGSTTGGFSSGISPALNLDGFTIGPSGDGDLTLMAFEGDAQLGVPPQNLLPSGNPLRCDDGRCEDFAQVRTTGNPTYVRLQDATNRPGNLMNGSNNQGGGTHPGLDIDTFDVGPGGLNVLRANDTAMTLVAGSGDGVADNGSGGSGELFLLSWLLLSAETYSPRFTNAGTEKVVLEPVAGAGEVLNYLLRVENDGSAAATNARIRDQLPAGVSYVAGSTTNTCGVSSVDVGGTSPVLQGSGLNVGTLSIGERCEVRFRVVIDDDVVDGTVLDNFFTIAADAFPPLLIGPASTVVQAAELGQPTKSVSVLGGGAPTVGATLSYRITIPNTGARAAPSVSLVDVVPAELQSVTVVSMPSGASNFSAGNTVDVRGFTIGPGASAEVVFTGTIRSGIAAGTPIANQGNVSQPSLAAPLPTDDPTTGAAQDPTTILVASGVSLVGSSKSATDVNGGPLAPGDVVEFRIHIDKSGPAADVIVIADDLPANVASCQIVSVPAFGSATCGAGGANGTGTVTGFVSFVTPGTADVVFRATVLASAPDGFTLVNSARLTPSIETTQAMTVTSAPLTVVARPIFSSSTKAVTDQNGGDVRPGDVLRYAVTVRNDGTIPSSATTVTDTVPAPLIIDAVLDGGLASSGTITWSLGALAVGASTVVRFDARVPAGTTDGTVIANTATISAAAPAQTFTTPPATVVVRASPILTVTKTVADLDGAPWEPGDVVRYTMVVSNGGDGVATAVLVRDTLDPSFETAILNAGGRVEGGDVVFDQTTDAALTAIAPGASVTLRFDARLLAVLPNGTVVANQARTTALQVATPVLSDDPTTGAPLDPTRFTVTAQALLSLSKTYVDDNAGALLPGDTVTFTLALENTGNAPATAVAVTDVLDGRLTFLGSPDGGAFAGGTVSFPTFTQLPGAPRTLRFQVRVAAPLANGTTIPNQAQATSPVAPTVLSDDPTTPAPLDPTVLTVVSRPVLDTSTKSVSDLDGDGVFEPGDAVRYTIVVANTGSEDALAVAVTDALPATLTNVVVGQGGSFAAGAASWAVGALAVNASVTFTIDATIVRPLADGVAVANQAFASATGVAATPTDDPSTPAVDDPTRFTVRSTPHLSMVKTASDGNGAPLEPGDTITWTLVLTSDGGRSADTVTLRDTVDASLEAIVPLDGGVVAGNDVTWSFASLAVDASTTVRFTARVRTPLANGTRIANQGRANVAEAGFPDALSDDPATPAPLDPTVVQVVSAADLAASTLETMDAALAPIATARPGELVRWVLDVQNRGRAAALDVRAIVALPQELQIVDAGGGTIAGDSVTFTAAAAPALATVAPGDVVRLVVQARLRTPLDDGLLLTSQAILSETGSAAPFVSDDPSTATFGDPTVLEVESAPNLTSFDKTYSDDNGAPVEPGDTVGYTLRIENTGDAIARNVVLADALPAILEIVDAGGGAVAGNNVAFVLGDVVPGAAGAVTRTLRVRVLGTVADGTVVANQATVAGTNVAPGQSDDPSTGAVDDPTSFTVRTVPRLTVSKDVSGGRIHAPDDVVTWTMTLTSTGTGATEPSTFADVVDASLTDVVPGPGLSYDAGTRTVAGAVAPLLPGASASFTFDARVASGVVNGTLIVNQATVVGPVLGTVLSDDPTTTTAADPTTVLIDARPNLTTSSKVAIDVDGGALLVGDEVRWLVTVVNNGAGAARDVRVTDQLPATLSIVSVENGGLAAGNTVVWDAGSTAALATIARGASVALAVVARINDTVADGTPIANQASMVSPDLASVVVTDDPATAPFGDPTVIVPSAPRLVMTKEIVDQNGGALAPGDAIDYRIVVENQGSVAATNLVIRDVAPGALIDLAPQDGGVAAGGVVTWTLSTLPPGGSATVRLAARVNPLAVGGTVIANQAEAVADEVGLPRVSDDPTTPAVDDPTTRVVNAVEQFVGTVELFDGVTDEPLTGPVVPNQRVRARIAFANQGTQVAQAVVLEVPLQRIYFVVDETTEGGVVQGDVVRWTASQAPAFARMDPGAGVTVELEGALADVLPDSLDIPVAGLVTSATSAQPTVIGPAMMRTRSVADLSATTKEVIDEDGGLVEPGDVLSYRITVLNEGGAPAQNARVLDAIPGGTVYLGGSTRVRGAPVGDAEGTSPLVTGLALGDVDPGRAVVVELQVRVLPSAPRGLRIDNQATLRADGAPDAASDNPLTPLVIGDATSVIVGGGSSLVAQKLAAPSPVRVGETLDFVINVENTGTEPARELKVEDAVPNGTRFVPGSLRVDGATATDATDRDDAELDGIALRFHRDLLEAGDGVSFAFQVVVEAAAVVVNQATVESSDESLLTDADPAVAGDQPTRVPVRGARALLLDERTTIITDDDGGALRAGDAVTVRTRLQNRSLEDVRVVALTIGLSAQLEVDEAVVPIDDLTFDPASRSFQLGAPFTIAVGGAVDVVFAARVAQDARTGDRVQVTASAAVESLDETLSAIVDLGRADAAVGLLPGTGALSGTLFLDGGAHDGVFQPETDERTRGLVVLAFRGDARDPVQTGVASERGAYRLLPIPAGSYRLELRSPGGARLGGVDALALADGEVRQQDVAVQPTGAVFLADNGGPAERARVWLYVDDGDHEPRDDRLVEDRLLGAGQQGQVVGPQGLYRFDAPPGSYRIAVETPDPLTTFPSAALPVDVDPDGDPMGPLARPDTDGDVSELALPRREQPTPYFLRFSVEQDGPLLQRNHLPTDRLTSQLVVTKTANRKRVSVGDIVSYSVYVDNRALAGVTLEQGGVEIVDALPAGFTLVAGSYRLDQITRDARGQERRSAVDVRDAGDRVHTFGPFALAAATAYELRYNVVVGPGATFGEHENRAAMRLAAGQLPLSDDASARVQVVADPIFDLSTMRAKVFCDTDGDGLQSAGEEGVYGARLWLDTGHRADTDVVGKAHFSAIPAGMHLVKLDVRTLPPGTTVVSPRSTFYVSPGAPAQLSFAATCRVFVVDKPTLVVNEAAYRPPPVAMVKLALAGRVTPPLLAVNGEKLALPKADLGVGSEALDPVFAPAGPNLSGLVDGALRPRLVLVPRSSGAPSAWELRLEDLGVGVLDGTEVRAPAEAVASLAWMFAGRGGPPDRIAFDGRDPALGIPALLEGHLYRATLTLGYENGDRAISGARMFGVRAGAPVGAAVVGPLAEIDEAGGTLFRATGKPTPRLLSWLGTNKVAIRDALAAGAARVVVVVHTDGGGTKAPAALTAGRAAEVVKALASGFGIGADKLEPRGAGDSSLKVPNLRKKDRAMNRRVELLVEGGAGEAMPSVVAPLELPPRLVVQGQERALAADGTFALELEVPETEQLSVELRGAAGAAVRLTRDPKAPGGALEPAAAPPVGVEWRAAERTIAVAGQSVDAALLGVRVVPVGLDAAGGAIEIPATGAVELTTQVPSVDVAAWFLRVMDGAVEPASGDESGSTLVEQRGEGAVPPVIRWDGKDAAGNDARTPARRLRFRLVVKTAGGDVGISPDVAALVHGSAPAAAALPPPASTSSAASAAVPVGEPVVLSDPFDAAGKLRPDAAKRVAALAGAAAAQHLSVRVEAHSDDRGSKLERRTRSQRAADQVGAAFLAAGVPAEKVGTLGIGSDSPLAPNTGVKNRARNRRVVVTLSKPELLVLDPFGMVAPDAPKVVDPFAVPAPSVVDPFAAPSAAPAIAAAPPAAHFLANGTALAIGEDGVARGDVPAMASGEVVLDVRTADGARASLRARPDGPALWQGDQRAWDSFVQGGWPMAEVAPPAEVAPVETAPEAPTKPAWWPDESTLAAAKLRVELPTDLAALTSERVLVRGQTEPKNRVRIAGEEVAVDADTGRFAHLARVPEGDGELVIEATDDHGNVGKVARPVHGDPNGFFVLGLADTAFGGDGAELGERGPFTSATLGPVFLYGRGAALVSGRFIGPTLFKRYELTLHLDTARWQNDVFAPDLLDPDRYYPVYADSSVENAAAAASAFPLYLDLTADASRVQVGSIRTDLQGADLFRYQRARAGAQITFDRGWTGPLDYDVKSVAPASSPDADPWRTTATGFLAGGGGERHARVELMGTGSSIYFLRHERVVEGSERVSLLVRDGVTGAEVARTPLVRNVDYTVRYLEGRVMLKEPLGAFADASFITNHNLGQVVASNRVALEVEYEHRDDDPFQGVAGGVQLKQQVLGHAEVGGGFVYEAREGGALGYQLGGGHLRLYLDQGTWLQGELLGSQSVDAGNFFSTDGGLSYSTLGQPLDVKAPHGGGAQPTSAREGAAYKLEGQVQLGRLVGREANADLQLRAYVQHLQPGFFAGAAIVEQGQTKVGAEGAWQVIDDGRFKLRWDGVLSEVPSTPTFTQLTEYRTLHREIVTLRYEHKVAEPLVLAGEYGYGYSWDSGAFGQSDIAQPREFHTNVAALGLDWAALERLTLAVKQELVLTGDPQQIQDASDHFITHLLARWGLTEELSLLGGVSLRWSGENQANLGLSWQVNPAARVYATERFGLLPAAGSGALGWTTTSVVGGETNLAPDASSLESKAYAEYQLDGGISGDQSRGVLGLKNGLKLPWGLTLQLGYERIVTLGGVVPATENGTVPPAAFTDGTFYAAPGANGSGSYLAGQGSRDAASAGVEWKRGELFLGSQRFELRYDNLTESRGGHDRLWLLSATAAATRLSPELSLLARYNVALAQDLALGQREAYLEEGALGAAYRPVTHEWLSVLGKLSRRVEVRPLSLAGGTVDDYTVHAASVEPIVELPWQLQIAEKLALKHASQLFGDVPRADAVTALWINRVNWRVHDTMRGLGIEPPVPGAFDVGVEYRVLASMSGAGVKHGPLVELQLAPVEYFRFGVGWNFTSFSGDELDRGTVDRSGFFVRAVGAF